MCWTWHAFNAVSAVADTPAPSIILSDRRQNWKVVRLSNFRYQWNSSKFLKVFILTITNFCHTDGEILWILHYRVRLQWAEVVTAHAWRLNLRFSTTNSSFRSPFATYCSVNYSPHLYRFSEHIWSHLSYPAIRLDRTLTICSDLHRKLTTQSSS